MTDAPPPLWIGAMYLLMSVLTFIAYALDKRRARRGHWRISERTLHLLEFLGGWPGALLAQLLLHHKNRKPAYMLIFLLIVALHVALWLICYHLGLFSAQK